MNFLNLQYFLIAAEELNFTKAAKRLYITQQSLSNHIAKLEQHYGVPLFDRVPPMTLTTAGKCLKQHAQEMLSLQEATDREMHDILDFRSGNLTIGISRARATVILPTLLANFHKAFPNVHLHLYEGTAMQVDEALEIGRVDVTLGFMPENNPNICSEVVLDERSVIVVPKTILKEYFQAGDPNLERKAGKKFSLKLFAHCPFVTIHPSTYAGLVYANCCRDLNIKPACVVETVSIMTLVAFCLEGMGACVCPEIYIKQQSILGNSNQLSQVEIFPLDYFFADTRITINHLKNKYQSRATREFIQLAKNILRQTR